MTNFNKTHYGNVEDNIYYFIIKVFIYQYTNMIIDSIYDINQCIVVKINKIKLLTLHFTT